MKLVWVVKVSGSGKLIWDSFREARDDYQAWRAQGMCVLLYPILITIKKLNSLKEYTGP